MSSTKEFEHLRIPLEDIKTTTNNFGDTNRIGGGGFGKVYKGELVLSQGLTTVAIKRLDKTLGQGIVEFWKEVMLLSLYKHHNLVSLLGFSDEGGESILVYEFLSNRSLDLYLSSSDLSWNQRLRICIGAARGLQYLHEPAEGSQQRVLHRDIKSANILLDENWKPKISDFGLSKFGPANQQFTFLYSNAVGTVGYCDPLYGQTGFLTKESDIYSFGVVLFEVLCGRCCVQNYDDFRRFLPVLARKCYDEKELDTIIYKTVKEQISPQCLERFSTIAYQCLRIEHTERPSVSKIVKELEIALEYQEEYEFEKRKQLKRDVVQKYNSDEYWETKLPRDWKAITRNFNIPPSIYAIKKELFSYLQKGILFDEGNKFFWINDNGKKCLLISARRFLDPYLGGYSSWLFQREYSRFSMVADFSYRSWRDIRLHVETSSLLSLGTMYAAYLVFKWDKKPNEDLEHFKLVKIKWKTEEMSVISTHTAQLTPDNWYKIRIWHFDNNVPDANFEIVLEELSCVEQIKTSVAIQGIEFQPLEMLKGQPEGSKGLSITDEEDIANDDEYWEKKLPNDYRRYIEMSDKPLNYTSKKELYIALCQGFPCNDGHSWFSLCKSTGGICCMLPARFLLSDDKDYVRLKTQSLSESRFGEVKNLVEAEYFEFKCKLESLMFSPQYMYACYLVFKFEDIHILPHGIWWLKAKCDLDNKFQGIKHATLINIPTIKPKNEYGSQYGSSNPPRNQGYRDHLVSDIIKERKDGWMEVMLCKPLHHLEDHKLLVVRLYKPGAGIFSGMIIQGIEFRPRI